MSSEDINILQTNNETKIYENFNEFNYSELKNIKKNNLTIIHINICSLSNKSFHKLQVYLEKSLEKNDMIIITETNSLIGEMNLFNLNGYNMEYYCRDKKKGGGIAIYIKENIKITRKETMKFQYEKNIEIEIDNENILINAIYRSPSLSKSSFQNELK